MIIDVHAHAIPASFVEYMERNKADLRIDLADGRVVFEGRTTMPLRADLQDSERRLAELDRMGIDIQVLAGWIDLTGYELAPLAAVEYSRAHNEALAAEAAVRPDRYRWLGTIPLQDPSAAVAELERGSRMGMAGIEIATTVAGTRLDKAGLDAVWEAAESLGAFVLLHPMAPLRGVDLSDYFMENMVGRPSETSLTLAALILSGVFERFPDLKVCAVHGGGFVPFQIGRLDRGYEQKPGVVATALSKPPSEYLSSVYVDTVVHNASVLRFLIDTLGAERIMLGTDYPFEMGDDDPIASVDATPGLTPDQRRAIVGGNAADLVL